MQTLSFEEAIIQAQRLLDTLETGNLDQQALQSQLTALVATSNGARGFFVTFLPGSWSSADHPPESLLTALRSSPQLVAELMTKNLAMSTAMVLTHRERNDENAAQGSLQVAQRSTKLIHLLQIPALQAELEALQQSLHTDSGIYTAFLKRWGYTPQQQQSIAIAVAEALNPTSPASPALPSSLSA